MVLFLSVFVDEGTECSVLGFYSSGGFASLLLRCRLQ